MQSLPNNYLEVDEERGLEVCNSENRYDWVRSNELIYMGEKCIFWDTLIVTVIGSMYKFTYQMYFDFTRYFKLSIC